MSKFDGVKFDGLKLFEGRNHSLLLQASRDPFCGDVSPYSTFIFPHNFVTRLTNLGHLMIEGALDVKKGVKIAVKLSHGKHLMDYDHLIVYCNPGKNHWNIIVVFPNFEGEKDRDI